jgi:hypothetical protein
MNRRPARLSAATQKYRTTDFTDKTFRIRVIREIRNNWRMLAGHGRSWTVLAASGSTINLDATWGQ